MLPPLCLLTLPTFLLLAIPLPADDGAPEPKAEAAPAAPAAPGPATVAAKKEDVRIEVSLDGVFEARRAHEIAVLPEEWAGFTVVRAVEHGARVKEGDPLVVFETKDLDRAIEEQEAAVQLARLGLREAEVDMELLEKTLPLDLAAAERTARRATEDLERFLRSDKPFAHRREEFEAKTARNYLDYEKEELRQLEKMYKADDLTEDTEEIILERQKHAVERAEFSAESAKRSTDESRQVSIPRQEVGMKDATTRQQYGFEKSRVVLPLLRKKQALELEKTRRDVARAAERLAKLRRDRGRMAIASPADGIAYHGRCVQGSWSDPSALESKLRKGGAVLPKEVILTVVCPRPLGVRATVPEAELHKLRRGSAGVAVPTGFPELEVPVTLERLGLVPQGRGSFPAAFRAKLADRIESILPGMTCKVRIVSWEKRGALLIPSKALFRSDDPEASPWVWVRGKSGSPERRDVKAGRRVGEAIEILRGLKAGEEVLLEKPEVTS